MTTIPPPLDRLWNPDENRFNPDTDSLETWGEAEPGHGDEPVATPETPSYGIPDGGTTPDVRSNLLTDVRAAMHPVAPPPQEVHHVVEQIEIGAEAFRVKVVSVQGGTVPTALLEESSRRKRAFVRIIPLVPAAASSTVEQTPANPAAGAGAIVTVPAGQSWTLQSIAFTLTCSAAVANRNVQVTILDAGGRTLYTFFDPTALTASQVATVNLAPGNPTAHNVTTGSNVAITGNLPPGLVLAAGSVISINAQGLQAADQFSAIAIQTLVSSAVAASDGVWLAPRIQGGAITATSFWWKIVQGDAPFELKTQDGVDAVCSAAGSVVAVQVYEELLGDPGGPQYAPGPGV
jgi:hypothetical protein